jgi:hypothetical protein
VTAELEQVLNDAIVCLSRPDNVFTWSTWSDRQAAWDELDGLVARLSAGDVARQDLAMLFAPTGPIQDVSSPSGWGGEFLALAERFEAAMSSAPWCPSCERLLRGPQANFCRRCGYMLSVSEPEAKPPGRRAYGLSTFGAIVGTLLGGTAAVALSFAIRCPETAGMACLGYIPLFIALYVAGGLSGAPLGCYLALRLRRATHAARTASILLGFELVVGVFLLFALTSSLFNVMPAVIIFIVAIGALAAVARVLALPKGSR